MRALQGLLEADESGVGSIIKGNGICLQDCSLQRVNGSLFAVRAVVVSLFLVLTAASVL